MPAKILIVEDNPTVALDLQRRLIKLGYEVPLVAVSHAGAVIAAKEICPDMILMELACAGSIEEAAGTILTPIIYLASCSDQKTLQRARASRPYGYLIKPVSDRNLHAAIQMALERSQYDLTLRRADEQLSIACAKLEVSNSALEQRTGDLLRDRQRLESTLSSVGHGVITTDQEGMVTYLNPSAEAKIGIKTRDAFGLPVSSMFTLQNSYTLRSTTAFIEQVLFSDNKSMHSSSYNLICKNGDAYAIEECSTPMFDANNVLRGAVLVFNEVRPSEDDLFFPASKDMLTGLVSRSEFDRRLQKSVRRVGTGAEQHALIFLDIDQFTLINETGGYAAGDELLRQITRLLQSTIRRNDSLARLGGDEFGVLLEMCAPSSAQQFADKLRSIVGDFRFNWNENIFTVQISIGLVNFSDVPQGCRNSIDLLRIGDAACDAAKELGRNQIHVYQSEDQCEHGRFDKIDWHEKIQNVRTDRRLLLYKQTIASLNQTMPYRKHEELLLRLIDRNGEIVPPTTFIANAERYGLMNQIDRWVIQAAFDYIASHQRSAAALFSVNLSIDTLNDDTSLQYILDQIKKSGIDPGCICFEITEASAITNVLNARNFISELRSRGCKFALDDFGNGLPTFSHLKLLPVDFLKIDGAIIREIASNPVSATVTAAIHHIGQVMGLQTIAEFSEDEEILAKLRGIGVDYAQGYGVSCPEPLGVGG